MKTLILFFILLSLTLPGCRTGIPDKGREQTLSVSPDREPALPAPDDPMYGDCISCDEFLLNPDFRTVPSRDGLVSVWSSRDGWVIRDIQPEWETVFPYDTLILYRDAAGLYGYFSALDPARQIPAAYELAWPFSEGVAAVMTGKRVRFIDTRGECAVGGYSFPYNGHYLDRIVFRRGVCAVADEDRLCGVVGYDGNWVVPPAFKDILMEDDFLVCIAPGVRRQYGYDGALLNPCVVEDAWPLRLGDTPTGLFLYEVTERVGLMDAQGRQLTEPVYEEIVPLSSCLFKARLTDGVSYVVLDRKGRVVR